MKEGLSALRDYKGSLRLRSQERQKMKMYLNCLSNRIEKDE